MNIIMGLPRSGSTLLCNILAQNPDFQVEHTNPLPGLLGSMITVWSNSPDIKGGLLPEHRGETEAKLQRCAKAFCDAWSNTDKVVFNKSRGWASNILALRNIYPEAKIIVTVRDLREVFASFEKQHRKNPLLNDAPDPMTKHILTRANNMFSPKGMIGSCLDGIQDILQRRQEVFWLKYEDFARDPIQMFNRLYCYLEQPEFEHDFENIVNTATDPDHLYLHKFPHDGSGEVRPPIPSWPKYMSQELAAGIMQGRGWFNARFGYQQPRQKKKEQEPKVEGPGLAELAAKE